MWGGGGTVVSPMGASMELFGADGLPISLAMICAALALAIAVRWRGRRSSAKLP